MSGTETELIVTFCANPYPKPDTATGHDESSNAIEFQPAGTSVCTVGTIYLPVTPSAITTVATVVTVSPYVRFGGCGGYLKVGADPISLSTVTPSGRTSARCSPALLSLKFVCSRGAVGVPTLAFRFLFEHQTTSREFAVPDAVSVMTGLVTGNCHLRRSALSRFASSPPSSVRYQPFKVTDVLPRLASSIQSE